MATRAGLESSHLWLCDSKGGVYVLRDIEMYTESIKVGLTNSKPAPPPNWINVGDGFSSITTGFSGLVCGIQTPDLKTPDLTIRLGITHDNPTGLAWSKVICNVVDVVVGTRFIVRKTSNNTLFFTDMSEVDLSSKSKSLLGVNWHSIPSCPSDLWRTNSEDVPLESQHLALDENDRLFLVASSGHTCMYTKLGASDATWTKICAAPFLAKNESSVLSFFAFWRADDTKCFFKKVSAGRRSLWCLDSDPGSVWQLVLSDVKLKSGETELKTNWMKCKLPIEEEIQQFCADKCKVDGLFSAVLEEEQNESSLYSCSLNCSETESGLLEIPTPLNWSHPCHDMSLCRTSIPPSNQTAINVTPKPTSSLYPDLPRGDDFDLCCENGDCSFCQQAATSTPILPPSLLEPFESETEPKKRVIGKKRARYESENLYDSNSLAESSPKRARLSLNRYSLLEGVDIIHRRESIAKKVNETVTYIRCTMFV